MLLPTHRASRALLSLFVGVHVLAGMAHVGRETTVGRAVREVTVGWEKVLGVHQSWPMFASPPRSTGWLRVRGVSTSHRMVELPALPGEPAHDAIHWSYVRGGKLERNATSKKRDYLRASITRAACRARPDLASIRFDYVARPTPRPGFGTPYVPRSEWRTTSVERETWDCK